MKRGEINSSFEENKAKYVKTEIENKQKLCDIMSKFRLHAPWIRVTMASQSIFQGPDEGPTNLSFLTFKSYLQSHRPQI